MTEAQFTVQSPNRHEELLFFQVLSPSWPYFDPPQADIIIMGEEEESPSTCGKCQKEIQGQAMKAKDILYHAEGCFICLVSEGLCWTA